MTDPRASKLTLSDLIAPLPVGDFLGKYWQRRHYHAPGAPPLMDSLRAILGGFEVPHLLGLATEITAFGYVDERTDRHDKITAASALALYDRGYTLYFTLGQSAPLRDFAATIARDAGISTLTSWCSVFASRTSGGLKNHFDNNENFTVQLTGSKAWTIWENTSVDSPVHCYRRDEPLIVPDSGMYIDARARLAELGPGEEVVMSPGAVLYHPRGSWHATRAASESISLNICLEPMTWFDVLAGAASARLVSSQALRAIVPSVQTASDLPELARRVTSVVGAAQRALAELTPEDAAEACMAPNGIDADLRAMSTQCRVKITETSRLRKNSLAALDLTRAHGETSMHVSLFLGRMTRQSTLRVPPELVPACERVAGPDREFSPRKLAGDTLREEHVVEVARALATVGALRVVSGKR